MFFFHVCIPYGWIKPPVCIPSYHTIFYPSLLPLIAWTRWMTNNGAETQWKDSEEVAGQSLLVGGDWNMTGLFSHILGISSSHLTFIFFRGVCLTTNQSISWPLRFHCGHSDNYPPVSSVTWLAGKWIIEMSVIFLARNLHSVRGFSS